MIEGRVNEDREAIVQLAVRGEGEVKSEEIQVVVDTGYDGFLTLPPSVTDGLNLPSRGQGEALLADGSVHEVLLVSATVEWDGVLRRVVVEEVDAEPLLGMLLLEDYDLRIACREGGRVAIRKLTEND
jgi:clan AA aspartic protease